MTQSHRAATAETASVIVVEDDAELREDILLPGLALSGFAVEGVASAEAL